MDSINPERNKDNWVAPLERQLDEVAEPINLKNFSFFEDPNHVLKLFYKISQYELKHVGIRLNFEDDYCLDVSPYMILAAIREEMLPIFNGGNMHPALQKVLIAMKLDKPLRMSVSNSDGLKDVWAFPVQARRPTNTSISTRRFLNATSCEYTADLLCRKIDEWLGVEPICQRFTDEGKSHVRNLLGEVLNNAERHSQPDTKDGSWYTTAFMAKRKDGEGPKRLRCFLGFMSIGSTFYQSLQTASPEMKDRLKQYVEDYKNVGAPQSEETLWALCALQDGITCVASAEKNSRGGIGLMDVLEFVDELGSTSDINSRPKVTIISGNACIKMFGNYIKGKDQAGYEPKGDMLPPRVLWFNSTNTRTQPPDPCHIFDLDYHFPGTVVSVSFTMDPDYLESTL